MDSILGPSRAITLTLAKQARPQRCAPTTRLDACVARPCAGAAHCCHGWGGGPRGADRQLGGCGLVGTELVATLTFILIVRFKAYNLKHVPEGLDT